MKHKTKQTKRTLINDPYLLFLVKFFTIFIFLSVMITITDLSFFQEGLTSIMASITGFESNGNTIFVGGTNFVVTASCLGLMSASILASIIFSLKQPKLKKKLLLFLTGFVLLLLINIPRILLILFFAKWGLDADLMHTITWFIMSGIIILFWYYGMKLLKVDFNEII